MDQRLAAGKGAVAAVVTTSAELLHSEELRVLQAKFSSGVRFAELTSVAVVLALLAGIRPPNRDTKRQYLMLIKWFQMHWDVVSPFLGVVELRDEYDIPIDGRRESVDKGVMKWVSGQ
jgi:hypothetical protein